MCMQADSDREAAAAAEQVPAELLHTAKHFEAPGGQRAEHGVRYRALLPAVPVRAVPAPGVPLLIRSGSSYQELFNDM